jgi:flavin-dependent dehydrogenase
MDIAVIGAGPAGLSAAIGLARRGHHVTVLERDPAPDGSDHEEAYRGWQRRGVPQIRQGHVVLGRAVDMLTQHAPDVLDALAEEGIVPPYNPMLFLVRQDELEPGDEFLRPLPTRRIPFELTLRGVAEREPGIEIKSACKVAGVSTEIRGGLPRVRGVGLGDGSELKADFVVDAGGNKSPVQAWLRRAGANPPPEQTEESGVTYFGRYFRAKGEAPDPWAIVQGSGETEYMQYVVFPGDRGTYGIFLFAPSWDGELRAVRDTPAFMSAMGMFPSIAPLISEDFAEALGPGVGVTRGHDNVLRPFLADGLPAYLGSLPVGDALGTTDARLGWGLSFALTHGFAAATAIANHAGDPGDAALAYAGAVMEELEDRVRYASANSRINTRRWRSEPLDPRDPDEEKAAFVAGVTLNWLFTDPTLLRSFFRFANLNDSPAALFRNTEFVRKVTEMKAVAGRVSSAGSDPSRDELVARISKKAAVG